MFDLSDPTVALHHTPGEPDYPALAPFNPPVAYPEYPFQTTLDPANGMYSAVRDTLRLLGLDAAHYDQPNWNPLGELIRPGDHVLLKPNLVQEKNGYGHDPRSVTTHASLVRALLDYVWIALQGRGRITIGDAPLQKTNLEAALRVCGLDGVLDFAKAQNLPLDFADFRLVRAVTGAGGAGRMVLRHERLAGTPDGYLAVDLGQSSYLQPVAARAERFRVTDYDPHEMPSHHNQSRHEYLIPRPILQANVVLNLPKLKTHRKVGLTLALKNLIGINGHKDWLPHHTNLSAAEGGDEYQHPSQRKRLDTWLDERVDRTHQVWLKYALRLGRLGLRLSERVWPGQDGYKEGSWWGNDTLWRTVLDLNRILLYADADGRLHDTPQRRLLVVADGWLAGEGEGPLEPTPRRCGLLLAGFNPALLDAAAARLLGFDPQRISLLAGALADVRFVPGGQLAAELRSNEARWLGLHTWRRAESLAFTPARGWQGHIELP